MRASPSEAYPAGKFSVTLLVVCHLRPLFWDLVLRVLSFTYYRVFLFLTVPSTDTWYKRWSDYEGGDNRCAPDHRCKIILYWIFLIKLIMSTWQWALKVAQKGSWNRITLRLPNILCRVISTKCVSRSSFYSEVAGFRPATLLKMDSFACIWQRLR